MPRTVTKRCLLCRGLCPGIERRYARHVFSWVCAACTAGLPKDRRGDAILPEVHNQGDVIGPDPRPRPRRHFLRCPTFYDGCNCVQEAQDARKDTTS